MPNTNAAAIHTLRYAIVHLWESDGRDLRPETIDAQRLLTARIRELQAE